MTPFRLNPKRAETLFYSEFQAFFVGILPVAIEFVFPLPPKRFVPVYFTNLSDGAIDLKLGLNGLASQGSLTEHRLLYGVQKEVTLDGVRVLSGSFVLTVFELVAVPTTEMVNIMLSMVPE